MLLHDVFWVPKMLKERYNMRKYLVKVCYGVLAPGRAECAPPPCTRGARWCAAAASAPGGGSQSVAECGDRYTGYIYSVDTVDISTQWYLEFLNLDIDNF